MTSKNRLFLFSICMMSAAWVIFAADTPALRVLQSTDSGDSTTDSRFNSTDEYDENEEYEEDDLREKDENGQVGATLWVNRTGDARRLDLNTTTMEDCEIWREYWDTTKDASRLISGAIHDTAEDSPDSWRIITTPDQAEEIGLDPSLLLLYAKIKIYVEEVCGEHNDTFFVNTTAEADEMGFKGNVLDRFCGPYKASLEPTARELKLKQLSLIEDTKQFLANLTEGTALKRYKPLPIAAISAALDGTTNGTQPPASIRLRVRRRVTEVSRKKRDATSENNNKDDDDEETEDTVLDLTDGSETKVEKKPIVIDNPYEDFFLDLTDYINPILYMQNNLALLVLGLKRTNLFERYVSIGLNMKRICQNVAPDVDDGDESEETSGLNIGINLKRMPWLNLTRLASVIRDDTAIDNIFDLLYTNNTLGGSYLKPLLRSVGYDPNTIPSIFRGQVFVVRVGVFIGAISNFQSTSMDYNLDIFLRMAWRDPRLSHNYSAPILIRDEDTLENVWKPDPFFSNAKQADYHWITYLNFQMKIFNEGEVYYETRIKFNPSCNLVLCKYPHDYQTCGLNMISFAYPLDRLRFEWFSDQEKALMKNSAIQLPELLFTSMKPMICDGDREGVNYSCLRTEISLERAMGYHITQTYIPTSLALMFSWVGVWLPEDMMEGRIGLAITVLLTMSTESANARANLPSVSYTKAIDVWFSFITGFVFVTLLQTLIVISFGMRSNNLKKYAGKKRTTATEKMKAEMLVDADSYYAAGRFLDSVCRFLFPLTFGVFMIYYFFVVTKGKPNDCIDDRIIIT